VVNGGRSGTDVLRCDCRHVEAPRNAGAAARGKEELELALGKASFGPRGTNQVEETIVVSPMAASFRSSNDCPQSFRSERPTSIVRPQIVSEPPVYIQRNNKRMSGGLPWTFQTISRTRGEQ
jgi:hypothetical protein